MNNKNIPEFVQLPHPYINMDRSINSHLVNILNKGLDELNTHVEERFSEDEILMIRPSNGSLQFDFPGKVNIYYSNKKEEGAPSIYFYDVKELKELTIYVDERAEKALNYIKDYYSDDLIVYPYDIIAQDMYYETFKDGENTIIVVYGIHAWLSPEEFVLFSECARRGEIISRYFYDDITGANSKCSDSQRESGYYNTGNTNEQGFPEFAHMNIFKYTDIDEKN